LVKSKLVSKFIFFIYLFFHSSSLRKLKSKNIEKFKQTVTTSDKQKNKWHKFIIEQENDVKLKKKRTYIEQNKAENVDVLWLKFELSYFLFSDFKSST